LPHQTKIIMPLYLRFAICLALGLLSGGGMMWLDKKNEREWYVSPRQIEEAKAAGKMGVATRPGTMALRPIRSEEADALPYKWAIYGIAGMALGFFLTRRKPQT
jgi:hypothetical protein